LGRCTQSTLVVTDRAAHAPVRKQPVNFC
jgi:hypothetical protein